MFSSKSQVAKCPVADAETFLLPSLALLLLEHPHSQAGASTFTPSSPRCHRGEA